MAAAAILDFKNFKFLTVGGVTSEELRQFAKFHRNRSKCGWDMVMQWFGLRSQIQQELGRDPRYTVKI